MRTISIFTPELRLNLLQLLGRTRSAAPRAAPRVRHHTQRKGTRTHCALSARPSRTSFAPK